MSTPSADFKVGDEVAWRHKGTRLTGVVNRVMTRKLQIRQTVRTQMHNVRKEWVTKL